MSGMQALFMNYGQTLSTVDSADFDGTDYMTRGADLTGIADSKTGIASVWIRIDGDSGVSNSIIRSTSANPFIFHWSAVDNLIKVGADNAASTEILLLVSATAYTTAATWLHILASWNLATATAYMYINDVDDLAGSPTLTDDTIDYDSATDWGIGATTAGGSLFDGCFAELYFAPGQFLDFSIVANRRRFISANGKPVWLGADGAIPTGTAPIVYQRVADAAAVATFATNLGTGGDFAITGTLTTGSTSPSD